MNLGEGFSVLVRAVSDMNIYFRRIIDKWSGCIPGEARLHVMLHSASAFGNSGLIALLRYDSGLESSSLNHGQPI